MSEWSLETVLEEFHKDIQERLKRARKSFGDSAAKGKASETVWLKLLQKYLPQRYQAATAHVVDSLGAFSDQIDIVMFDRQYTPFILRTQGQTIVPAEGIYAVFEAKQTINASHVRYAQEKASSVRRLHRTSIPTPHAGGTYPPKKLIHILGGVLAFESDWSPALGESFQKVLEAGCGDKRLDIGCVAAHGHFCFDRKSSRYEIRCESKSVVAFLFKLISELHSSGTVPSIDILAYAKWLSKEAPGSS